MLDPVSIPGARESFCFCLNVVVCNCKDKRFRVRDNDLVQKLISRQSCVFFFFSKQVRLREKEKSDQVFLH